MAKLTVYDWNKKKTGDVEVSDEVFGKELRKDILQQVVRWQLACRRQGTHSTKTRGKVRGGGAKPFKQKGTGNARQGSTRSPLHPGGGTTFGPQPRDYSYTLPKSIRRAGLKIALSYLKENDKLFVVDEMTSKDGKTKELFSCLCKFGLNKAVLVDSESDVGFGRASKNLADFAYQNVEGLNVYDLLKYNAAIVTKRSLEKINEKCGVKG